MYGLKQAARQWSTDIKTGILAMGFIRLVSDFYMYVQGYYASGTLVIIVLYVNDMSISAQHQKFLNQVKHGFMTELSMKDLGEPKKVARDEKIMI